VCDTADKLAQRLDLLCLQKRGLGLLASRYFLPEFAVRPFKVGRSLGHQTLKLRRGPALSFKIFASFILSSSSALCGNYRRLKGDGL
jgi:hypothetical protein